MSTLGFHLDGRICRVGCSFCYLAARTRDSLPDPQGVTAGAAADKTSERSLDPELLRAIVDGAVTSAASVTSAGPAPFTEIAVAVSEPARRWRRGLAALSAAARRRGLPLAVTTTTDVVAHDPWVLEGATRVSLSIDPEKPSDTLDAALAACADRPALEVVALVSLASPAFAATLADGLLADLLADERFRHVALNGIKPPPPWCDRAFWLRFCARIRPLLERHLHRRLHLDCYVGARILGLGGCPAKPDVAPGREFRACVYQARPDFVFANVADLAARTRAYVPPDVCPFPIT